MTDERPKLDEVLETLERIASNRPPIRAHIKPACDEAARLAHNLPTIDGVGVTLGDTVDHFEIGAARVFGVAYDTPLDVGLESLDGMHEDWFSCTDCSWPATPAPTASVPVDVVEELRAAVKSQRGSGMAKGWEMQRDQDRRVDRAIDALLASAEGGERG